MANAELHLTLNQGIATCHLLCSLRKSCTVLSNVFHLQTILHERALELHQSGGQSFIHKSSCGKPTDFSGPSHSASSSLSSASAYFCQVRHGS